MPVEETAFPEGEEEFAALEPRPKLPTSSDSGKRKELLLLGSPHDPRVC